MKPEQIEKDLMGRDDPHELRPSQLITAIQRITKQRYQLAADNQRLREALSAIAENLDENLTESFGPFAEDRDANDPQGVAVLERARTALAATPAQALDAFTASYVAQVAELRKAFFDLREIGNSFPAPVNHECIEPTGECYDCLRIAFDKGADALASTPAQSLDAITAPYEARIAELVNALGFSLEVIGKSEATATEKFVAVLGGNQALSATPLTALAAYRRKVLEEAANAVRKECEVYSEFQNENAVLMAAAEVIRRMAGEE